MKKVISIVLILIMGVAFGIVSSNARPTDTKAPGSMMMGADCPMMANASNMQCAMAKDGKCPMAQDECPMYKGGKCPMAGDKCPMHSQNIEASATPDKGRP